jgi:hypothetical protein
MRGRLPVTGTYTGDGSNGVSVNVGFRPRYVRIVNYTDADVHAEHIDGMPDASAMLVIDSGSGTTDLSKITSAGITLTSLGFEVGTNANLIENGKVYRWVAF